MKFLNQVSCYHSLFGLLFLVLLAPNETRAQFSSDRAQIKDQRDTRNFGNQTHAVKNQGNTRLKDGIKLSRQSVGIPAKLLDQGDYYLRPDGSKISLLRKRDVFVIDVDNVKRSAALERLQTQYSGRLTKVSRHGLGGATIVRINNSRVAKQKTQQQFDLTPLMLKSIDRSIRSVKPVFANAKGQGDIALLSKLTIKLNSGIVATDSVSRLESAYGLQVERKLRLSGNVYSFFITDKSISASATFALVRSIMRDTSVNWVEPQFMAKAYKTSFLPTTNPLFTRQWHLRNTGFRLSRCDTDCDANNAWDINNANGVGAVAGDGMVIAVLDDGVQLDHEDLDIWVNTADPVGNGDEDNNGYIDDINGWDFVDDPNTDLQNSDNSGPCLDGDDGTPGPDNDPSPQATTNCLVAGLDLVEQDDHGTAVSGLAAAIGYNNLGVVGTAFRAKILPIRVISSFDNALTSSFCITVAEAMAYAGRYADVINNSWGMNDECMALEDTIDDVVAGTLMDGGTNVSKRKSTDTGSGSPVLFASGNSASGWIKVTVPVSAGEHAYEWRLLRSPFPEDFDPGPSYDFSEDNTVWLDEITWPDNSVEGFENGLSGFDNNRNVLNSSCEAECTSFLLPGRPKWTIENQIDHVFSGTKSARIDASGSDCGNIYLHTLREDVAGEVSFWVWVSTNTEADSDKFEFLLDGKEELSFGDISAFVDNAVGYPASQANTIAVGASGLGDLSGVSSVNQSAEIRNWYSQYGPELDFLAPSDNQHLGITTTDRSGVGDGYNFGASSTDYADQAYTNTFGGTSAATPIAAGIAAAVIAMNGDLDASEVRTVMRDSSDKIGSTPYVSDRNDFYGYGRVNMHNALQVAVGGTQSEPSASCSPSGSAYSVNADLALAAFSSQGFCPAKGPLPFVEETCFPIVASEGKVAVVCL